jgi:hypothetical protein
MRRLAERCTWRSERLATLKSRLTKGRRCRRRLTVSMLGPDGQVKRRNRLLHYRDEAEEQADAMRKGGAFGERIARGS